MNQHNPLVSVIIPVYNCERYLSQAIESVLAQKYRPLELVIVDDGSTDNTAQVAAAFSDHIHYIYQPNQGAPAARNTGFKIASGDIIAFLDADDLWTENKLELQVPRLVKNHSVDIVLGYIERLNLTGYRDNIPQFEEFEEPQINLSLATGIFRRSVFDRVGLFDEKLYHCDDWDWFMRARELGISIAIYPELTLLYRRHENNMTNQVERGNHYTIKMLKKSLERRRQANMGKAKSLPKLVENENFCQEQ